MAFLGTILPGDEVSATELPPQISYPLEESVAEEEGPGRELMRNEAGKTDVNQILKGSVEG